MRIEKEDQPQRSPSRLAWGRFQRNPLAMAGLCFIAFVCLVSLLGPTIRPDQSVDANEQNLVLARQHPGFHMQMLHLRDTVASTRSGGWLSGGWNQGYLEIPIARVEEDHDSVTAFLWSPSPDFIETRRLARKDLFMHHEATTGADAYIFERRFWLGTDKYGRDFLSRLMAGSVISLSVGAIAVIISLLVGLTIGLLAGYYRGWVDQVLMWFTNVVWSIPTLLLVMAITFAFGTGFWKVFLAVGLTMWVEVARMTRGQVLGVRGLEYVEAARALGFSEGRIMFRHILPNIMSPIIVISAANFASAILIEAGLSFLGLGAQIPTPSWGNIIREHYAYISTDLAYLALLPGLLIMLLVLSFMLAGNGLRDALDVRN